MDKYMKINQDWWNEAAQVHAEGNAYQLQTFKNGKIKLRSLERTEVGSVTGKKLLHLQCHFGLDTLSWTSLGAHVTGIDYAENAITIAQSLNRELQLDANFVCCDIYNLPDALQGAGEFDIVYTSYGVLCWLPDLQPWGKIIAHYLKPGGFFYIVEDHPFMRVFDEKSPDLKIHYPYFSQTPIKDETPGTYAERDARLKHTTIFVWNHTISEIYNSLLMAGLTIDFFHEHPFSAWDCLPEMEEYTDRFMHFKDPAKRTMIPLMFSLKATKK